MADRINKAHSNSQQQTFDSADDSKEKELLLSLSRVHYNSYRATNYQRDDSENASVISCERECDFK